MLHAACPGRRFNSVTISLQICDTGCDTKCWSCCRTDAPPGITVSHLSCAALFPNTSCPPSVEVVELHPRHSDIIVLLRARERLQNWLMGFAVTELLIRQSLFN